MCGHRSYLHWSPSLSPLSSPTNWKSIVKNRVFSYFGSFTVIPTFYWNTLVVNIFIKRKIPSNISIKLRLQVQFNRFQWYYGKIIFFQRNIYQNRWMYILIWLNQILMHQYLFFFFFHTEYEPNIKWLTYLVFWSRSDCITQDSLLRHKQKSEIPPKKIVYVLHYRHSLYVMGV